jgi:peroxiredoxin
MKSMLLCMLSVLVAGGLVMMAGCSKSSTPKKSVAKAPGTLDALLDDHRGNVLILLLGIEGCPGTAKATEALDELLSAKPEHVSVVRLDVPMPNGTLKPQSDWKHLFPCFVDNGRKIADKLEFFYYPTLYVFDGDGEKRYAGACDKDKLAAMTREILAEKPGAKKKIYSLPMPEVGTSAPAFSGDTLSGKTVSQDSLISKHGLMLIFARTSCRFCANETPNFKDITDRFHDKGVSVVVVNQQEEMETIKPVYEEKCTGVPVIWDKNGEICKSYGVDAVPFFFLLDKDGKVVSRRSFTHPAAINSINAMLGLKADKAKTKPTGGG